MKQLLQNKRNLRRGQAVVEFALVVPLLILILLATIEFGVLMNNHLNVANAAREGARFAALGNTTIAVSERINNELSPLVGGVTITQQLSNDSGASYITLTDSGNNNVASSGNLIKITVQSTHNQLTGFVPGLNGQKIIKEVVMRRE